MFERYTQAARNTIFGARYMASQVGSQEICKPALGQSKRNWKMPSGHDFAQARMYSDEEAKERDKLILFYRQHGLLDWIYE
jgi:hypothetical protein